MAAIKRSGTTKEGGGSVQGDDTIGYEPFTAEDSSRPISPKEPMKNPYVLFGMPASLYTAKVRSYLRKQRLDFIERTPGHPSFLGEVVPAVGRWIIPVLQTPEGRLIQDGADIIDHFAT